MDTNARLILTNKFLNFVATVGLVISALMAAVEKIGPLADEALKLGLIPKEWIAFASLISAAAIIAGKISKTPSQAMAAAVPPAKPSPPPAPPVPGVALLLLLAVAVASCVSEVVDVGTAEDELISADPCGVQTSPYNQACTKPGKTSWVCASYNSTTHRCSRARGTTPIPGTNFIFGTTPPVIGPHIIIWPAWGDTLATYDGVNAAAMQIPTWVTISTYSSLLTPGWSYATNDLTPGDVVNGLTAMHWDYIQLQGGTGICIYSGNGNSGEMGCWYNQPGSEILRLEPWQWGDVAIHSLYTFGP